MYNRKEQGERLLFARLSLEHAVDEGDLRRAAEMSAIIDEITLQLRDQEILGKFYTSFAETLVIR